MSDVSNVTAMVIDGGVFFELARRLAREYKKVYYCPPASTLPYPTMNLASIGTGYDEIEVIESPYDVPFEKVGIYIFPDNMQGAFQLDLEARGARVWGSRKGEELELDRVLCKEIMGKKGLPVGNYVVCEGFEELKDYLKNHNDVWVKISKYRGHMESWKCPTFQQRESKIKRLEWELGENGKEFQFIVEDDLPDKEESGVDGYNIDGKLPSKLMCGIEIKDLGWVGKFEDYDKIPEPLTRFDRKMADVFKKYGYRGFYSTEVRVGKDKVPYMTDLCARAGSPPNEVYQEMFKNLGEIIWEGSVGNCIDPIPLAKWAAEIRFRSEWAIENWLAIDFPKKYDNNIKLRNARKRNGHYQIIPQTDKCSESGAVVGFGNTMEEAIEEARKIGETIECYELEMPNGCTDKAKEEIEKLRKIFPDYIKD